MSISRFTCLLVAAIMSTALASGAYGQKYQPFINPDTFGPDLQFFAPADVLEYGGEPQANTGWFATYDRLYWYVSRPDQTVANTAMDHTWGNRFNVGYMTEDNHGWLFSATHIDGPNAMETIQREKIDQWLDNDPTRDRKSTRLNSSH